MAYMDFKEIRTLESYIDISSDIAEMMNGRRWNSLVMPEYSGKTTLLSMLYYFFDLDEDSEGLFIDSEVAHKWDKWRDYLNYSSA